MRTKKLIYQLTLAATFLTPLSALISSENKEFEDFFKAQDERELEKIQQKEALADTETSYPHLEVYLSEEFLPLIGKRVQCHGYFKRSPRLFEDDIVLDVDTALDCEQSTQQLKTVFYEPEEVELIGMLHKMVYPGPPEYMSVEMGDHPEEVVILTLKDPINVEAAQDDNFNESEKGVRELQVVFEDSTPTPDQMKEPISLQGTLYHAHTAHHRRRVLMTVKNGKMK